MLELGSEVGMFSVGVVVGVLVDCGVVVMVSGSSVYISSSVR